MPFSSPAPYLVTLGFDPPTFERLDQLRSRYFPPERNQVPAHLSMFHQLPGDEGEAVGRSLGEVSRTTPVISLSFPTVKKTGRGMMVRVEGPALASIRGPLARAFSRWLTPQDRQPFHPHVTIMNKVEPSEASVAFEEVRAGWVPFTGKGTSLLLWLYRGGPWEAVEEFEFRGITNPAEPGPEPS